MTQRPHRVDVERKEEHLQRSPLIQSHCHILDTLMMKDFCRPFWQPACVRRKGYGSFLEAGERRTQAAADVQKVLM